MPNEEFIVLRLHHIVFGFIVSVLVAVTGGMTGAAVAAMSKATAGMQVGTVRLHPRSWPECRHWASG